MFYISYCQFTHIVILNSYINAFYSIYFPIFLLSIVPYIFLIVKNLQMMWETTDVIVCDKRIQFTAKHLIFYKTCIYVGLSNSCINE